MRILLFLWIFGVFHYIIGCLLQKSEAHQSFKKGIMIFGVVADLVCLFSVKYINYAISLGNRLLGTDVSPVENLIFPLGISFLCFSMVAYFVDIYRKKTTAFTNVIDFFLFLSFFPKVSQGPITRHGLMYDAICSGRTVSVQTFADGFRRFVIGLGKKVLIADVLGGSVDLIFDNLSGGVTVGTAWMGILCYTLQIYYDFSGYTDMAIGIGNMLGFTLPENFRLPYLSKSVSEFWRRWHMTLGEWFKEYVYFPMGGSRKGLARTILNLAVVWMFTGLWHGASTNYVLWGVYFGCFVILEKLVANTRVYKAIPTAFKWLGTLFVVMMGWVVFRSPDLLTAQVYFNNLISTTDTMIYGFGYYFDNAVYLAVAAGILFTLPRPACFSSDKSLVGAKAMARDVCLVIILLLSILFMMNSTYNSFIYFQF
ncbi:MAG: MBOAT family protein [Clostridia bacterium]|nr:MBOAT family protein [Clostridia bacterium]